MKKQGGLLILEDLQTSVASRPNNRVSFLLPELPAYLERSLSQVQSDQSLPEMAIARRKFTELEKDTFIRTYVQSGGNFSLACNSIESDPDTVYFHFGLDQAWQRVFNHAKLSMGQILQSTSYNRALEPAGVIDRMCQLKRFFPSIYKENQASQMLMAINFSSSFDGPT